RRRPPHADELAEVDGRALARGHRLDRAGRVRAGHPGRGGAAHGQPDRARPGLRPRLRAGDGAGGRRRRGAQHRQRLRRLPERGGAHPAAGAGCPVRAGGTGGAVVTGLGIVAPNGVGVEAYWAATLDGTSGLREIGRFDPSGYPSRIAGEVTGFAAEDHLPARLLPQTGRMTRMALAAAGWAVADACLRPAERAEFATSVATASSSGGFEFGQR